MREGAGEVFPDSEQRPGALTHRVPVTSPFACFVSVREPASVFRDNSPMQYQENRACSWPGPHRGGIVKVRIRGQHFTKSKKAALGP